MKSNIIRMVTLCMCMFVVGFASDTHYKAKSLSKKHEVVSFNKNKKLKAATIDAYNKDKKLKANQKQIELYKSLENNNYPYELIERAVDAMRPGADFTPKNTFEVAPQDGSRDGTVSASICSDYWSGETYWILLDTANWWAWGADGWTQHTAGSDACQDWSATVPAGNYLFIVGDSYGDGGGTADVSVNGESVGSVACASGDPYSPYSGLYEASIQFDVSDAASDDGGGEGPSDGNITFNLDGVEDCGFVSVTGTFDGWSGWGANNDNGFTVAASGGDHEFVILCVNTAGEGEWWNDIWANSTVINAPIDGSCWNGDYDYANYALSVDGDATVAYCAGTCDEVCAAPSCEDQGYVDCGDGQCIYDSWICDGWSDCSNGSDEADCEVGCSEGQFDCGDGQCIPGSYVCDGSSEFCNAGWGPDCANGADEGLESCGYADECEPEGCADGEFDCGDGSCIYGSWECDGWSDCADGSDEADCVAPSCEDQGYVDCGDGQCIYDSWICDGYADCSNGSDEADCGDVVGCSEGQFDCGDGQCIPGSFVCDGSSEFCNAGWPADCANGADEGLESCGYEDECAADDGGSEACADCEYDFTAYGSECCDTAWDDFGIDCATLESNYLWDCSGCACPGDVAGDDGGSDDGGSDDGGGEDCVNDDSSADAYGDTCSSWYDAYESEGSSGCTGSYDDDDFIAADQCCVCGGGSAGSDDGGSDDGGAGCGDGEFDCGDGQCIPASYVCDGSSEFCNASWPADCANGADEGLESCGYADECGSQTCADTYCGHLIFHDGITDCEFIEDNSDYDCTLCWEDGSCDLSCADTGAVDDCSGDGDCAPSSWIGDGWCDGTDQPFGYDLTCYDNDGGDCAPPDCCGVPGGDNSTCGGSGDVDGGGVSVTDIVAIIGDILLTAELDECAANEADLTGDGEINVMDVIAAVDIILAGNEDGGDDGDSGDDGGDDGGAAECDEGYSADCSGDGDCCPDSWIADGFADCEDQAYGCDLTCYDNDGGDCDEAADDGGDSGDTGGSEACTDCEFDFTAYGSECCDTAWDEFGIDCATLEANYSWDCSGCACPGDIACEDQGLITCEYGAIEGGSCAVDESGCLGAGECAEGQIADCDGSGECWPESWVADGFCDDEEQQYGADLLCYEGEAADCEAGDDGAGDDGGWEDCPAGTVADCVDEGECGSETWIGDGYCDGVAQQYGINNCCYDNDGGDCTEEECTEAGDDGGSDDGGSDDGGDTGSSEACTDCEYDFTAYGAECCDTAWDAFGIDCATLESNYFWDCSGCVCPGDAAGDDGGSDDGGSDDGGGGDCVNDDSSADAYGDTCSSWYDAYESEGSSGCTGSYDDDDFIAADQCCVCGGGSTGSDDGGSDDGGSDDGGSDDGGAGCADGEFDCGDGQCIPASYVCDGSSEFCNAGWGPDCANGADEGLESCGYADECVVEEGCADGEYDCGEGNGGCIPGSWECDVYYCDCNDCVDESDCDGRSSETSETIEPKFDSMARSLIAKKGLSLSKLVTLPVNERSFTAPKAALKPLKAVKKSKSVRSILKDVKNLNDVIKSQSTLNRTDVQSSLKRANSVKLIKSVDGVRYESDGFVGFEMTLNHGDDFKIDMAKGGFSGYNTVGNTTKLVIVNNETTELFSSVGDFEIVDVLAGTSDGIALSAEIVSIPSVFGLSSAYPNPFNPSTSFDLAVPYEGFVSVKVYNLMGQLVSTLHEGNLTANSYNFAWNAENMASGMYLLKAESAGNMAIQKIMLMK